MSDGFAGDLIDLGRRETAADHFMDRYHHSKRADSIRDKVWAVLCRDDTFSQPPIEKARNMAGDRTARILAGNNFNQLHITRRVEEMDADKMLFEILRERFDNRVYWNSARSGCDH